jgi:serine protease Do
VLTNIPASPAQVRRLPWMGVLSFNGVSREVAEIKKIKGTGVTVEQVLPDQPAANAGLKDGDIILAVNGENIEALANPDITAAALLAKIRRMPANQKVKFTIRRGEETKDVEVTLAPTPTLPDEAKRYLSPNLGFIVREKVMLDQYLDKSSTSSVPGLPVLLVGATTAAATAGMLQGDLIVNVNGQQVTTVAAMKKIIDDSLAADSKKPINVVVRRGDQSQNLTIKPIMSAASQP